jgi:sugar fermentation stimulation protein A
LELPPLFDGTIVKRYKRFLADVTLASGEEVVAHCPNTGSMAGCWTPGAPVQLSASDNPKRKLKWTLERVDMGNGWIGVNTTRVNPIVRSFVEAGEIETLRGYGEIKSEPGYSPEGFERSRFDLLLENPGLPTCYVEIKNTTLVRGNEIQFPDAVTARGRKHLELLQHAVCCGYRGVILFAVNRPEGNIFRAASDIDPEYHQALVRAHANGVEILPFRLKHTATGIVAGETLPFSLD